MARGTKRPSKRRQARSMEGSAKSRGMSSPRSKQIAYATVNKQEGGKKGMGRGKKRTMRKGVRKAARR